MISLVAVCVSSKPETFKYDIPFVCLVDDYKGYPRGTPERAKLVGELRNKAMEKTLEQYPDTTHVLMIDSYYLEQITEVRKLINDYNFEGYPNDILGSSTWLKKKLHMRHIIRPEIKFYDFGSTPEAINAKHNWTGVVKVECVGACYIFPVSAWIKNKYNPRTDIFEVEHKSLCKGYNCYIDYNSKLWREDMSTPFSTKVKFLLSHIGLGEGHYEA